MQSQRKVRMKTMEDRAISLTILDAKYNRNVSIEQAKKYLYAKIDGLCNDEYNTFSKIIDDMYNELPPVNPQSDEIADGDRAVSLNNIKEAMGILKIECELQIAENDIKSRLLVSNLFCKMFEIIGVLPSVNPQEPKYCDRKICLKNEYNGIGCDECEVTKSQEPKTGHWKDFAVWVAKEIFDDEWEYNKDAFAEIACRKLNKLGIVKANGDKWELVEPQESEVRNDHNKV